VAALHRRQTEGFVITRVFFVAYPYKRGFQKPNHGCEHFFSCYSWQPKILRDSLSNRRQCLGESHDPIEFILVAHFPPSLVVSVLFSAFGIAAGCLQMAIFSRANPHVGPSGWNRQGLDSATLDWIPDNLPVNAKIDKAFALSYSSYAGHSVGNVPQAGYFC
jgi:hypothetical protein